jgi:hypothetical protein
MDSAMRIIVIVHRSILHDGRRIAPPGNHGGGRSM